MKVFHSESGEKVNFVDDNNAFVGYDTSQSCCESAGWFIADNKSNTISGTESDEGIEEFSFDCEFFEEVSNPSVFDEGGMVIFRLVSGSRERFLHVYNAHNGCYGHGFAFAVGDQDIRRGCL